MKNYFLMLLTLSLLISCAGVAKRNRNKMVTLTKNVREAIILEEIGALKLKSPTTDRQLKHFSAASGIQIIGERLYVVADDEQFLASFSLKSPDDGELYRALPGDLAQDSVQRKKSKADWEALVHLPTGELLLIPSGSKINRHKAVLWDLQKSSSKKVDMTLLYAEISKKIKELNIEAAVANDQQLILFNRGNGKLKENAMIILSMDAFLKFAKDPQTFNAQKMISSIRMYESEKNQIPIATFSDTTILSNGQILFIASIENTENTYQDGEVLGSYLGFMEKNGDVKWMAPFSVKMKAEGLSVRESESDLEIFITTDPDDQTKPSILYKLKMSQKNL